MAKAYVCDAYGIATTNPYEAKMKELYVGMEIGLDVVLPSPRKRKIRVHLCDECYHALHEIAKGVSG